MLTVDVKTSDLEQVRKALSLAKQIEQEVIRITQEKDELISVLMFYASTPRSGLHEDAGNYARRTIEKLTNSNKFSTKEIEDLNKAYAELF